MIGNLLQTLAIGIDRNIPELLPFKVTYPVLNIGAGPKLIDNTIPIDADRGWLAGSPLPFDDESIGGAYAFHFFEHLNKKEVISVTRELERVLVPGGSFITVTPHPAGELAFQDIDHKSFWNEQSWYQLLKPTRTGSDGRQVPKYQGTMERDWKFRIHTCLVAGIVLRNLVTLTQIVRIA